MAKLGIHIAAVQTVNPIATILLRSQIAHARKAKTTLFHKDRLVTSTYKVDLRTHSLR